ncbi:mitochondrial-processing peptidase subunit alpha [Arctopsyche grandis]|uniref:mitochondrial-processing peptidase subunit alpha n=1 Tax=Arctopsyche grandis TaxID=121162 RepID=UPI00406D84BB
MALRLRLTAAGRSIKFNEFKLSKRQFSREPDKSTVNIPSTEIVTPLPPLTEPMPGLPTPIYSTSKFEGNTTEVTTLSNGLKVASEKRFGQFCTVGVVVDSGSRYEVAHPSGISHFLEKLAFGQTQKYGDKIKLLSALEKHGGICDCQSSRDALMYATSADTRGLSTITQVLAEVVLRPILSNEEVEMAQQAVAFDLETLAMRPEQETILIDMIHSAGYGNSTLGLPKICPQDNVAKIDKKTIFQYISNHFVPKRMVVAGVGVEHGALVEYVQKYFVDSPSAWPEVKPSALSPDLSKAKYAGGIVHEDCEVPLYPGSDLPELSHVVIGFESCSHQDDDFIAMCVLNMMMGGGGSFSAGGPGKGMYTRLYTNVLNRYHWMYNATAYNHAYADSGLFCIHASSPPPRLGDTVDIIVKELVAMSGHCPDIELKRAKTQLQSMLLMNLEARPVVFEDIARQVLATGMRRSPTYFIEAIESVTVDDVRRVAQRLLSTSPSVAARGRLGTMRSLQKIQDTISNPPPAPGRLSLFR